MYIYIYKSGARRLARGRNPTPPVGVLRAVSLFFRCLDCKSFFKAFGSAFGRFRVQFLITFGFFFASLPCAHSPICRSPLWCQHYASASSFSCLYNHVNHGCGPGDLVHCSRVPCLQTCPSACPSSLVVLTPCCSPRFLGVCHPAAALLFVSPEPLRCPQKHTFSLFLLFRAPKTSL